MTQPIQEPSNERSIAGAYWATQQLARRPSTATMAWSWVHSENVPIASGVPLGSGPLFDSTVAGGTYTGDTSNDKILLPYGVPTDTALQVLTGGLFIATLEWTWDENLTGTFVNISLAPNIVAPDGGCVGPIVGTDDGPDVTYQTGSLTHMAFAKTPVSPFRYYQGFAAHNDGVTRHMLFAELRVSYWPMDFGSE